MFGNDPFGPNPFIAVPAAILFGVCVAAFNHYVKKTTSKSDVSSVVIINHPPTTAGEFIREIKRPNALPDYELCISGENEIPKCTPIGMAQAIPQLQK